MNMKQELPCKALSMGYILLPKQLFRELLDARKTSLSELEAWLCLLTEVNYKESVWRIEDTTFVCDCGESLYSIGHWAERFGWTRSKTRYYLHRLQRQGRIRLLTNPKTTHLRITDYELWTGCRTKARQQIKAKMDEDFERFWQEYHEVTRTDKVNIARALKEWRKLTLPEQTLAIEQIETYYEHLRHVKFCMQAATYLANKAFLNEYE